MFRPEKLPQVGELLAKYDLKLKTLIGAVAAKYLTKDSAENLLKDLVRGVTKGADTELGWSTELEEANKSLDEAIGYLDLDYPDAAEKVRQNRRSRPKGGEEERASPTGTAPGLQQESLRPAPEAPRVPRAKERVQGRVRTQSRTPATLTILMPVATSWTSARTLHPEWLSAHYLNTVVEGHKHGGERAFKSWIQTIRSESLTGLTAETVGTSAKRR